MANKSWGRQAPALLTYFLFPSPSFELYLGCSCWEGESHLVGDGVHHRNAQNTPALDQPRRGQQGKPGRKVIAGGGTGRGVPPAALPRLLRGGSANPLPDPALPRRGARGKSWSEDCRPARFHGQAKNPGRAAPAFLQLRISPTGEANGCLLLPRKGAEQRSAHVSAFYPQVNSVAFNGPCLPSKYCTQARSHYARVSSSAPTTMDHY